MGIVCFTFNFNYCKCAGNFIPFGNNQVLPFCEMTDIPGFLVRFKHTKIIKHPQFLECNCFAFGKEEFDAMLGILITSVANSSNKDHTLEIWKSNHTRYIKEI